MSTDRMDWDNLRVFRVVAELGSMSAAAARLGESPPTIGRKLDDLEKTLKVKLISRTTRGVQLTDAGRRALEKVLAIADLTTGITEDAAAIVASDVAGRIHIAAGDGLGPFWIAPRIADLQKSHPKLQIKLSVLSEPADVTAGEADVSVQFSEPRNAELISHKLGTVHYMSFASQEYIEKFGAPTSMFEYFRHRCILHQNYVHQIERWVPKMPDLRKTIDFALITNSGAAMKQACLQGAGIAILPSYSPLVDKRLIPLDLPEVAPIEFWLCYTERVRRLAHGKVVLDWLHEIFDARENICFEDQFHHPGRRRFVDDEGASSVFASVELRKQEGA